MTIPRTPTGVNTGEAVPKYRNLWSHIKATLPRRSEVNDDTHPLTDYLAEADGPLKQLAGDRGRDVQDRHVEEFCHVKAHVPPARLGPAQPHSGVLLEVGLAALAKTSAAKALIRDPVPRIISRRTRSRYRAASASVL